MTHSLWITLSRRALQLATLLVAAASVTFAGEPVTATREHQVIGHITVTAARERPLIGHIVVTESRLAPVYVLYADLGTITVTARRDTALARNDQPRATHAAL
jgi:hypothetical protein